MELKQSDAFLILRTAYESGLLEELLFKDETPDMHVPGTSFRENQTAKLASFNFDQMARIADFLARLICKVREESATND